MAQIRQFYDPNALTKEELNTTLEDRPMGEHEKDVMRRIHRDNMREENGLSRKENRRDLFIEGLMAAMEDD
ncbi:hypothetical protein [Butyrivibrio sp.]|uniref:hypothetical protein n=1 Tax=Butyrivibrio sp. TaxID=28121 RepID=UPI0025C56F58|nr:hypothetical protein [Butyrivibrio sp.]MBQ7428379.1 hypothetical protein [Butyrivibrio sp.]MBQ9303311.1 hypothetical protein [Butyrivibrio sp.]